MDRIALGQSTYGIMSKDYPFKRMLDCFPEDIDYPCIAALFGTFGKYKRGLRAYCNMFADRKHLIEMHISNECARRTGRQGAQILPWYNVPMYQAALTTLTRETKRAVRERVTEVMDILATVSNKNTVIVLSAGLESDLKGIALDNLHTIVKNVSKKRLIYSANGKPEGTAETIFHKAQFLESHSIYPNPMCTYWNNDGTSIAYHDGEDFKPTVQISTYLQSFKNNYKGKKAVFLWDAKSQGLDGVSLNNPIGYDNRKFEITDNAIQFKLGMLNDMQSIIGV